MSYADVSFAYREEATSAKLNQLAENVEVHDHRPDGTQGAPIGRLTTPAYVPTEVRSVGAGSIGTYGTYTIPACTRATVLFGSFFYRAPGNLGETSHALLTVEGSSRVIAAVRRLSIAQSVSNVDQSVDFHLSINPGAEATLTLKVTPFRLLDQSRILLWNQG